MKNKIETKGIERLFTSKVRVKILEFFFFKVEKSHIREISRELKIPVSAVKREVDNLISINLLILFGKEIILNKKCNYLEDLRNLFIKTDYIIYPIRDALKNEKIQYAFVFGSFAQGNFDCESDVDVIIVSSKNLFELAKLLKPIEGRIKREINPVAWRLNDLKEKKNTGFVKDILSKKIIMLIGDENELRKIVR